MPQLGALRAAGLKVLPTGTNPDHFDVQLLPGVEDGASEQDEATVLNAAQRLLDAAGELRPNPAYAGDDGPPEDD